MIYLATLVIRSELLLVSRDFVVIYLATLVIRSEFLLASRDLMVRTDYLVLDR